MVFYCILLFCWEILQFIQWRKKSKQPLEKLERKVQKGSNKLKLEQNQKTKSRNTLTHQGEAATSSGIVRITFTESARRALCEQFYDRPARLP